MENLPPPPGGDVNRGPTLIVLCSVMLAFSTVTTAMRIGTRVVNRQLSWDDYTIFIAWTLLLIGTIFNFLELRSGFGRHGYYLTPDRIMSSVKWSWMSQFFLFLILCVTKISISLFVLRIKDTGWLKWTLIALMTGLVATTIPCVVVLLAQCDPVHAFWDRTAGTCWRPEIYANVIWAQVGERLDESGMCEAEMNSLFDIFRLPTLAVADCRLVEYTSRTVSQSCGRRIDECWTSVRTQASSTSKTDGCSATCCAAVRASLSLNAASPDPTCKHSRR